MRDRDGTPGREKWMGGGGDGNDGDGDDTFRKQNPCRPAFPAK